MSLFTLLHTNDFHNRLTPTQAEKLASERAALGTTGLLLDAGDAISAGNITYKPGGEPILDRMSDAGYDAMTVGNREFHFSRVGFAAKLSRARFPVLCANVRNANMPEAQAGENSSAAFSSSPVEMNLPVQPYLSPLLTCGGETLRVTVFGLTVPMITERMLARKVSAYVFDDPLRTAERWVPVLRANCDMLICLSHIGLAQDRRLAASVPGIDLIIGGHTHAELPDGEGVGGTMIVQTGAYGHSFGRVLIAWDGKEIRSLAANLETL